MSKTLKQKIADGAAVVVGLAGLAAVGYGSYKAVTDEGFRSTLKEIGGASLQPALIGGSFCAVVDGTASAWSATSEGKSWSEVMKAGCVGVGRGAIVGATTGAMIGEMQFIGNNIEFTNTVGG